MNYSKILKETGKLPIFHLEAEVESLKCLPKDKPSAQIYHSKKWNKTIAALSDLDKNHNHSWYQELKLRASKEMQKEALFYRGRRITFRELFHQADMLAAKLLSCGVKAGDEIPVCMSNVPELVYLMLAANHIGAKLNIFGAQFDPAFIQIILKECSKKMIFCTDDLFRQISDTILSNSFENIIVISLCNSMPENTDEYDTNSAKVYHFDNNLPQIKESSPLVQGYNEFLEGIQEHSDISDKNTLDTEFLITYTSGSTKIGYPKAIVHRNRSLITMGRFHDAELSRSPKIEGLRGMAHIHPESNTDLITCISDNLMQLYSVALEPLYDSEKALDYVLFNKPNILVITPSFLIEMAKQYFMDKKYHMNERGRKLDFLFAVFAVGEPVSKGEEAYINKFLKESRAGSGIKIHGFSVPYVTLSIGGGDCEHGGIYYTLWKSFFQKIFGFRLRFKEYGMMPVPFAQVSAFRKKASNTYEECSINEYGLIAANSAVTMAGYKNRPDETARMILKDNLGREWISCNTYGYIDELGGVHVRGRIGNGITLEDGFFYPAYQVEEIIADDANRILSCTVICKESYFIANVQFRPDSKEGEESMKRMVKKRCMQSLPKEICKKLKFRFFSCRTSMPLTPSGKRSLKGLEEMNLHETFSLEAL